MTLSLNKFSNISKLAGMTTEKMMKASYEIIYKRVQQQSGQAIMNLESFFTGLQLISTSLFSEEEDQNIRIKLLVNHLIEHI